MIWSLWQAEIPLEASGKKFLRVALLIAGVAFSAFAGSLFFMRDQVRTLRVGCPTYWGSLVPALQHTAYADALLSNQFESIVREGHGGAIVPGLAKSWTISEDFRIYRFLIDRSRKFSNGSELSAESIKQAWESGLLLNPESANSSLQDVLYLVSGFDVFKSTKHLTGLKVISDEILEVEFVKPFRTALSEFATGRMSVFLAQGDETIGTGPYVIHEEGRRLSLIKNRYFPDSVPFERVEVDVVAPDQANNSLLNGNIDLYAFADRAVLSECGQKEISCFSGVESGHLVVVPNGMPGRIFSDAKLRLALQYLIHSELNLNQLPVNYRRNLTIDGQVYLPMQPGRMDTQAVEASISAGEEYVPNLIAVSRTRPLYIVTSDLFNWVQPKLERAGVKFDSRSGIVDSSQRIKMYYKTFEPDLFVMGTSVASGDPDGLFHILAKDGAITSPTLYRPSISRLLEDGRQITDSSKLDGHYTTVSKEVLKEVPFVHVGFIKGLFAYSSARVKVADSLKNREGNQFTLFAPR